MFRNNNYEAIKKILSVLIVGGVACLCYAVSSGIRSNYGIMLTAIIGNSQFSYSFVSFTIAIAQLISYGA